jgi:hypothetical protein
MPQSLTAGFASLAAALGYGIQGPAIDRPHLRGNPVARRAKGSQAESLEKTRNHIFVVFFPRRPKFYVTLLVKII